MRRRWVSVLLLLWSSTWLHRWLGWLTAAAVQRRALLRSRDDARPRRVVEVCCLGGLARVCVFVCTTSWFIMILLLNSCLWSSLFPISPHLIAAVSPGKLRGTKRALSVVGWKQCCCYSVLIGIFTRCSTPCSVDDKLNGNQCGLLACCSYRQQQQLLVMIIIQQVSGSCICAATNGSEFVSDLSIIYFHV